MNRKVIIAFVIILGVALPSRVREVSTAQSVPPQRFEVSSVTACPPPTVTQTGTTFALSPVSPGGLRIERTLVIAYCQTADALIHMAYNGGLFGHRNAAARDVLGGPEWIRSERYTIEGRADGAQHPDLTGAMMRSLLEERFQLRVRRHVDDAPMYALKVARGGLRIKPLAATECVAAGEPVPCGTFKSSMNGTVRIWDAVPATMQTVANLFDLDRLVIDKTGVKDRFAIHLELETVPPGTPAAAATKALEQLGLTLVSITGRRSWVQIESIERPREKAPTRP